VLDEIIEFLFSALFSVDILQNAPLPFWSHHAMHKEAFLKEVGQSKGLVLHVARREKKSLLEECVER